jgi:hypothetical protein
MPYVRSTEMNMMPQLMSLGRRDAFAYVVRKTSWRQVGTRISGRHGSGGGEELS